MVAHVFPTQPGVSFDHTADAGDANQKGLIFDSHPPGPMAKFNENFGKAYAAALEDSQAREEIAKNTAKREGMTNHGKAQNAPPAACRAFGIFDNVYM